MKTFATTRGGRDGRSSLEDGKMVLGMSLPKELAGASATEGMNPEQLFAMGWSSCYGQAIIALSKKHGVDATRAAVTCEVTLNKDETSFALTAELKCSIPGEDPAKVKALMENAHEICPYSKATRGNVPVTLTVL
ncbi:MAG: Ohr subfamily peroxiredoxin [Rhizobiales bacterium 65-9]|nr:organic hydroperoxide resistance protein [Hyphomicrobiales bacterium]OJY36436.1 MAG: Ohr subfamily peroxiredoxin [Rhizobiales bacterium 65-9]